jgi:hypothetical protein
MMFALCIKVEKTQFLGCMVVQGGIQIVVSVCGLLENNNFSREGAVSEAESGRISSIHLRNREDATDIPKP